MTCVEQDLENNVHESDSEKNNGSANREIDYRENFC